MKATEANLLDLMGVAKMQFVIPVYQRVYSWSVKECEVLWDDVMRTGRDGVSHFVGSMLYIPESESSATSISRVLLIDGQQRMTTFSLMISALADYLESNPDKAGFLGDLKISALRKNYLFNDDDYNGLARYKLVLSQDDKETLFSIVSGSPVPDEKSDRIVENHAFFREKMHGKSFDPARLWAGLNRVQVIDTKLTAGVDNAQLIFESMNSKGKPLMPIDLIRNYVLMSFLTTNRPSSTRATGIPLSVCLEKGARASLTPSFGTGCGSRFPIGSQRRMRLITSSNGILPMTTTETPRVCSRSCASMRKGMPACSKTKKRTLTYVGCSAES